jgi:hypothetical protein
MNAASSKLRRRILALLLGAAVAGIQGHVTRADDLAAGLADLGGSNPLPLSFPAAEGMSQVRRFQTLVAVDRPLYVAADRRVYAFVF